MTARGRACLLGAVVAAALSSCAGGDPGPDAAAPVDPASAVPAACRDVAIDPFKELIIVDEGLLASGRASNRQNGPWSFRHAFENLLPPGQDLSAALDAWFGLYKQPTTVNLFRVPARLGNVIDGTVECPWLKRTPSNGCNESCSVCAARVFDLAEAPFRLIAIANRLDLRETSAYPGGAGEGRLVFALTDGPADDPASPALRMTAALEYYLPSARSSPFEWAARWHRLGAHEAFDEPFAAELVALTEQFVARGADPAAPLGGSLAQVRTNEREFDWQWEFREFRLAPGANRLALSPLFNTPDRSLNGAPQLVSWASENRDAILRNQHTLPLGLTGGVAVPTPPWLLPGLGEQVRKALASQTCDGCHQTEQTSLDVNFHVSPMRPGVGKLSPFLHDPAAPTDELRKRADALRRALCASSDP